MITFLDSELDLERSARLVNRLIERKGFPTHVEAAQYYNINVEQFGRWTIGICPRSSPNLREHTKLILDVFDAWERVPEGVRVPHSSLLIAHYRTALGINLREFASVYGMCPEKIRVLEYPRSKARLSLENSYGLLRDISVWYGGTGWLKF